MLERIDDDWYFTYLTSCRNSRLLLGGDNEWALQLCTPRTEVSFRRTCVLDAMRFGSKWQQINNAACTLYSGHCRCLFLNSCGALPSLFPFLLSLFVTVDFWCSHSQLLRQCKEAKQAEKVQLTRNHWLIFRPPRINFPKKCTLARKTHRLNGQTNNLNLTIARHFFILAMLYF